MRPTKNTLDFIQLDTTDKTTLKRLHRKFGMKGRLFWYELLRLLGRSCDYYLDLSDNWILEDVLEEELFIDKTTGVAIIEALVDWGLLDKKLWQKRNVIWCQSLIDRHVLLFNKRKLMPQKPPLDGVSVAEIEVSDTETVVSDAISTQSKVKESKEKDNYVIQKEEVESVSKKQEEIKVLANRFAKNLENKKEQAWRESFYMMHRLHKGSLSQLLTQFKSHLVMQPPDNLDQYTYAEFKKHFSNWVNVQNREGKLKKYKND